MTINQVRDDVFAQEYDLAFPQEAEYNAWIASLEDDLRRSGVLATPKTRFYDADLFDPFDTINS